MASAVPDPAVAADDLIFQWAPRSRPRWRLAVMLVLSLLLHAASFYILQVAFVPTSSLLPPPARVTMVPLDRPEYAPLARWLAMADPALLLHASAPAPDQVLDSLGFSYVPSYDAAPAPFKPLEPPTDPLAIAPPRPLLPGPAPTPPLAENSVPAARADPKMNYPRPTVAANQADDQKTRAQFTDGLAARLSEPLPAVEFHAGPGAKVLNPAVYLVGIPPAGGPAFVFRQSSSGEAAADAYARAYLAALNFSRAADSTPETSWGWVTFYWGNGVYR